MRILAADIGGTKTLIQLADADGKSIVPLKKTEYRSNDFASFEDLLDDFLAEQAHIERACFAVAGPVKNHSSGQESKLTNLEWLLDSSKIKKRYSFSDVFIVNDFQAVGYGINELGTADLYCLQTGEPQENGVKAVIGAGTGLGQAFLTYSNKRYQVWGTEAGHTDFAPQNALQIRLLQFLQSQFADHVSYERIVSGQGICHLYQFFASESPENSRQDLQLACNRYETARITAAADEGDALAKLSLDLFFDIYGAQTGNWALNTLPSGGLYIAGGIAVKLQSRFLASNFMKNFLQKGRMSKVLEKIPVYMSLNPEIGLLGSLRVARDGIN